MRSRRRNRSYRAPEDLRRIRIGQNLLLLAAGLATVYLVVLAIMKAR